MWCVGRSTPERLRGEVLMTRRYTNRPPLPFFIWMVRYMQDKTSAALAKLMSLQAMEAVLVDVDTRGNIVSEKSIVLDFVQTGDILKVSCTLV